MSASLSVVLLRQVPTEYLWQALLLMKYEGGGQGCGRAGTEPKTSDVEKNVAVAYGDSTGSSVNSQGG